MDRKKCFKCGTVKNLSEFYRHAMMADGHLNKCKECTKSDSAARREKNIEQVRQYYRDRSKLPHRKEKNKLISARWREENKVQRAAQVILGNAIKKGLVMKQPCSVCGKKKAHAHHPDYSQPLDVVWLCAVHHKAAHRE